MIITCKTGPHLIYTMKEHLAFRFITFNQNQESLVFKKFVKLNNF